MGVVYTNPPYPRAITPLTTTPPRPDPLVALHPHPHPFPLRPSRLLRPHQNPLLENRHMPLPYPLHQRLPLHALMVALCDGGERGRVARQVFEGAEAGVGVADDGFAEHFDAVVCWVGGGAGEIEGDRRRKVKTYGCGRAILSWRLRFRW